MGKRIDISTLSRENGMAIFEHDKDGLEVIIPPGVTMVVITPTDTRVIVNQESSDSLSKTATLGSGMVLQSVMYDQPLFDVCADSYETKMSAHLKSLPEDVVKNAPPEIRAHLEELRSK